jgi:hypothetical protein
VSEENKSLEVIKSTEIIIESSGSKSRLDSIREIPNTAALDHATTAGKIAVGLLPIVGSTLSEILGKTTNMGVFA